jgi:molecular chaperone GrpE
MTTTANTITNHLLPPGDLRGEIDRMQEELGVQKERTLRVLADFTNYRRRIEREGDRRTADRERSMMLPLLDIVDDMDKALAWAGDDGQPMVEGMLIIRRKLLALLEEHGVLPIESIGKPFDHDVHDAVAIAQGGVPGFVVDELRRGYLWNNDLLRAAQVRVSGDPSTSEAISGNIGNRRAGDL